MPTFKYTGAAEFYLDGGDEVLMPGDTVDRDERDFGAFDDQFELVDEGGVSESAGGDDESEGPESETSEESSGDPPIDPEGMTVSELEETLEASDFTPDELEAIREAEVAADDRKTAVSAIDDVAN